MRTQKLAVATVWMAAVRAGFWPIQAGGGSQGACLHGLPGRGDLRAANLAKAIASSMFRKIGVTLVWVDSRSCPPDGIHITLTGHTPDTLQPGALAYALPYGGTHIRVFRDRIEGQPTGSCPAPAGTRAGS